MRSWMKCSGPGRRAGTVQIRRHHDRRGGHRRGPGGRGGLRGQRTESGSCRRRSCSMPPRRATCCPWRVRARRRCRVRTTRANCMRCGPADPIDQQAITWCAALSAGPGRTTRSNDRPATTAGARYRAVLARPPAGLGDRDPETARAAPVRRRPSEHDLWTSGASVAAAFRPGATDMTLVNWPQMDYWRGPGGRRLAGRSGRGTGRGAGAHVGLLLLAADRGAAARWWHRLSGAAALRRGRSGPPTGSPRRRTSARAGVSAPSSPCWSSTSA